MVDRAWGGRKWTSRHIASPPFFPIPITEQYALDREREHHEHVAKHGSGGHDDHEEAEKGKAGGDGSFGGAGSSSSGAGRDSSAGVELVDRRRQVALAMSGDGREGDLVPWAAKHAAAADDDEWGRSVKKRRSFLEVINPISAARGGLAGESPRLFARPPLPPPQLVLPRDVSAAALLQVVHDSPGMKGLAARDSPFSLGGGVEGSPLSLDQRKHLQGRALGERSGSKRALLHG